MTVILGLTIGGSYIEKLKACGNVDETVIGCGEEVGSCPSGEKGDCDLGKCHTNADGTKVWKRKPACEK